MNNGRKKTLTTAQIREAKRMLKAGKKQTEVAEHFGVSQGTISIAIRGVGAYKKAA